MFLFVSLGLLVVIFDLLGATVRSQLCVRVIIQLHGDDRYMSAGCVQSEASHGLGMWCEKVCVCVCGGVCSVADVWAWLG